MKLGMKVVFILNSLIYWFLLHRCWRFIFENVLDHIFSNAMIMNIIYLVGIFVVLLPLSVIINNKLFKYIRRNYDM